MYLRKDDYIRKKTILNSDFILQLSYVPSTIFFTDFCTNA